jgi:hypothetical protein
MNPVAQILLTSRENDVRIGLVQARVAIAAFLFTAIGAAGSIGTASIVFEIPSGAINGSNITFTTVHNFVDVSVFLNGLRMVSGTDYIVTGVNSFNMVDAPLVGDNIAVMYTR